MDRKQSTICSPPRHTISRRSLHTNPGDSDDLSTGLLDLQWRHSPNHSPIWLWRSRQETTMSHMARFLPTDSLYDDNDVYLTNSVCYLFWLPGWQDFPLESQPVRKLTQCKLNLTAAHQWWRKRHQQARYELFQLLHQEKHGWKVIDICLFCKSVNSNQSRFSTSFQTQFVCSSLVLLLMSCYWFQYKFWLKYGENSFRNKT